ncbi:MAG: hypothetical protein VR72_17140 [Clostridiaceae bacterium BRH_c20a]|nr:MAG: hypothetical protein VR72_17140 [Clostridiaceae bacterium BRH_c20a]
MTTKRDFVLFGLDKHNKVIDYIRNDIVKCPFIMDIELIISEAVSNAFIHGNQKDVSKPIYVRYKNNGKQIVLEIEDCGPGYSNVIIPKEISDDDLLNEGGRGLFLISCIADEIIFFQRTIIIKKNI